MPKVKNIEIKLETHDQIVEWAPDTGDGGVWISVDIEFDKADLWDHYISILCLNNYEGILEEDNVGFYFEPWQAKMSLEQAIEWSNGKDFSDPDTIDRYLGNLFMSPVYTYLDDDYEEYSWYAIMEDYDEVWTNYDSWDWDLDWDFASEADYEQIEQFDPYWKPYHIKGFVVVNEDFTDGTDYANVDGWHVGFGNHDFECYVDVSDTPRTFIYNAHYYDDRNL